MDYDGNIHRKGVGDETKNTIGARKTIRNVGKVRKEIMCLRCEHHDS